MVECGLVLEGGGMKGMYTAGVLEYFMEKNLYFQNCYGVSAGACHLCSYISKQKKRAYRVALNYLKDKELLQPPQSFDDGGFVQCRSVL